MKTLAMIGIVAGAVATTACSGGSDGAVSNVANASADVGLVGGDGVIGNDVTVLDSESDAANGAEPPTDAGNGAEATGNAADLAGNDATAAGNGS